MQNVTTYSPWTLYSLLKEFEFCTGLFIRLPSCGGNENTIICEEGGGEAGGGGEGGGEGREEGRGGRRGGEGRQEGEGREEEVREEEEEGWVIQYYYNTYMTVGIQHTGF